MNVITTMIIGFITVITSITIINVIISFIMFTNTMEWDGWV